MISLLDGVKAVDIIIEVKKKERAIARLIEELRSEGISVGSILAGDNQ
ncbi:MAG: hypothetical protein QW701_01500 [Candidatus Nezhaarchaeales archaeon]